MKSIKVKWPKVLDYNNLDQIPLVEWIDLGNATMFRIFAYFCHGGTKRPRPGLVVGIERIGSFFFGLGNIISGQYVSEKLNVCEADSKILADWINVQLGIDAPQQGEYNRTYILGVRPYGLIGERFIMPLCPEII